MISIHNFSHRNLIRLLLCLPFLGLGACTFRTEPEPLPKGFFALEAARKTTEQATGWIGLFVEMNDSDSLESLDLMPGVRMGSVIEGGPADKAGLQVGDILLSFNGVPTDDPDRLAALLRGILDPGIAKVEIQRGSQVLATEIAVELAQDHSLHSLYFVDRALLKFAVKDGEGPGAFPEVYLLAKGSSLKRAKVKPGDRILEFQHRDPGSAKELIRRVRQELQPGDPAWFVVQTGQQAPRQIKVRAWRPSKVLNSVGLWPLFDWEVDREENRSVFEIGDLVLLSLFKVKRVGEVRHWSILSIFHWETGRPTLMTLEDEG